MFPRFTLVCISILIFIASYAKLLSLEQKNNLSVVHGAKGSSTYSKQFLTKFVFAENMIF